MTPFRRRRAIRPGADLSRIPTQTLRDAADAIWRAVIHGAAGQDTPYGPADVAALAEINAEIERRQVPRGSARRSWRRPRRRTSAGPHPAPAEAPTS
jgi:hypothetical protein